MQRVWRTTLSILCLRERIRLARPIGRPRKCIWTASTWCMTVCTRLLMWLKDKPSNRKSMPCRKSRQTTPFRMRWMSSLRRWVAKAWMLVRPTTKPCISTLFRRTNSRNGWMCMWSVSATPCSVFSSQSWKRFTRRRICMAITPVQPSRSISSKRYLVSIPTVVQLSAIPNTWKTRRPARCVSFITHIMWPTTWPLSLSVTSTLMKLNLWWLRSLAHGAAANCQKNPLIPCLSSTARWWRKSEWHLLKWVRWCSLA